MTPYMRAAAKAADYRGILDEIRIPWAALRVSKCGGTYIPPELRQAKRRQAFRKAEEYDLTEQTEIIPSFKLQERRAKQKSES
jgi:hypothetical protein